VPPSFHEVADIGDVNAQLPLAARGVVLQADGVVKVARVGRVDGEDELGRQVLAGFPRAVLFLLEALARFAGFLDGLFAEHLAQAVALDDRLRLHIGATGLAEHLHDDALGVVVLGGVAHDLEHDLVAGLCVLGVRVANDHRVAQGAAVWNDVVLALDLGERARERSLAALDDFEHATGHALLGAEASAAARATRPARAAGAAASAAECAATAARVAPPQHLAAHGVAVQRVLGVPRGYVQVALSRGGFGNDEAKPARVELQAPRDLLAVLGQAQLLVLAHVEPAGRGQLLNSLRKGLLGLFWYAHLPTNLVDCGGLVVVVGQVIDDALGEAKRHRKGV
jgi:hypothetical protein